MADGGKDVEAGDWIGGGVDLTTSWRWECMIHAALPGEWGKP